MFGCEPPHGHRRVVNSELRGELLRRYAADQAALANSLPISQRLGWGPLHDHLLTPTEREDLAHTRRVQRENVDWLRGVIQEHGWPHHTMVGEDGAEAAWLLAQHADTDVELQRLCLALMTEAHARGQVAAEHFAALSDRVALAEGEPQIYATQLVVVDGVWTVRQPCNVQSAATLREELGLDPIETTIAEFQEAHPSSAFNERCP